MATEFICTIKQSGGDYSTLASWEDAIDCGLTWSDTKVFNGTKTGTIGDGASVTLYRGGSSQGVTATVLHATSSQIGLVSISDPSFAFQSGDEWRVNSSNYFTISTTGDSMIAVAQIDGEWTSADTTEVSISGWTTSQTNYIKIYTTSSARHDGKWNTSKYRLSVSPGSASGAVISIYTSDVWIDGLQIENTRTDVTDDGAVIKFYAACSNSKISNSILKFACTESSMSYRQVIRGGYEASIIYVWNSIILDAIGGSTNYTSGIQLYNTNAYIYVYNCTIHNCQCGLDSEGGTWIVKNCIIKNCPTTISGTFYYLDYCSTDGNFNSGTIQNGNTANRTNQTFSFRDESNDDFHLTSQDSGARDHGTDLSNDSYLPFSTDIDGQTRPSGSAWDIGADEYMASALNQYAFRFVNDDGDEDESTFVADENANISANRSRKRIRFTIDATGNPDSIKFQLEYRRKPSGGSWGGWNKISQ